MKTRFETLRHDGPARLGKLDCVGLRTPAVVTRSEVGAGAPPNLVTPGHPAWKLLNDVGDEVVSPDIRLPSDFPDEEAADAFSKDLADVLADFYKNVDASEEYVHVTVAGGGSVEAWERSLHAVDFGKTDVITLKFGPDLERSTRDLANLFDKVRCSVPVNTCVVFDGKITPAAVPILYYLGADVFTDAVAAESVVTGRLFVPFGLYDPERLFGNPADVFVGTTTILAHELSKAAYHVREGTLRSYVEGVAGFHPVSTELLRHTDLRHPDSVTALTPVRKKSKMLTVTSASLDRPEVRTYRSEISSKYVHPMPEDEGTPVNVLIFPCSARKPYSTSRSHRVFREAVGRAGYRKSFPFEEIIVTSPLGAVPRALEKTFPAGYYDIPVTGDWDVTELEKSADVLATVIRKLPGTSVFLAHVDGGYRKLVELAFSKTSGRRVTFTDVEGSVSSRAGADALASSVKTVFGEGGSKKLKDAAYFRSRIRTLFGYVGGLKFQDDFFNKVDVSTRIRRASDPRGPREVGELLFNGVVVATGSPDLLDVKIKPEICDFVGIPAERTVRTGISELKGSSVFCVGVEDAGKEVFPGSFVYVIGKTGEILAVGDAVLSGAEMTASERGIAVEDLEKYRRKK